MTSAEPQSAASEPVVLDASALGAVVFDEPGAESVLEHLATGVISAVNMSELAAKAVSRGGKPAEVWATLQKLPLRVAPFDADQAYLTASLYPSTHRHGLSLADRACLALGMSLKCAVLTADRAWTKVSVPVEVRIIR